MAQMWLLWWPKTTAAAATTKAYDATSKPIPPSTAVNIVEEGSRNCCCGGLRKLVKKLKKRGRMLRAATACRQTSSIQCRYDPLSYSLNFDTSGCGSLLDDEDYYQFCAFSSRFVANPRSSTAPCPRLVATAH